MIKLLSRDKQIPPSKGGLLQPIHASEVDLKSRIQTILGRIQIFLCRVVQYELQDQIPPALP